MSQPCVRIKSGYPALVTFDLAFRGAWRDYQQRVLDELAGHLSDSRLNVVAAPGSGKTVLGLEVMCRIGRPALILAPTIAIRNQWVDRLSQMFLAPGAGPPDWISTSIADPRKLTVSTYQALHAGGEEDGEPLETATLAAFYNAHGQATLILDEAHHLRNSWWKALAALAEALNEPRIVALTATPPYDVDLAEWRNYASLCGPADAEISIPELVRNGDLCPHQDYVHISRPTVEEEALVVAHRDALLGFILRLRADPVFLDIVAGHSWIVDPAAHEAEILEHPEMLSAMIVFANGAGRPRPQAALDLLGLSAADVPDPDLGWLELLLTGLIFGTAADPSARIKAIRSELRALGAIEGKRVKLFEERAFYPTLAGSLAKLGSIIAIARAEAGALGERLRMAVLADYVRADELERGAGEAFLPAKLGAASIFEALRRAGIEGVKLGVLTGPMVILPAEAVPALLGAASRQRVPAADIATEPLVDRAGFVRIVSSGAAADRIVALVTALFEAGEINLLIGTQALLGEGWDAPGINSLVLASYVGSYMLSNQMRGRAIRTDPRHGDKTANIWHLATVLPETLDRTLGERLGFRAALPDPFDPIGRDLGPDMALLKRRFQSFEGVGTGGGRIENGLARLGLGGCDWSAAGIDALNQETLTQAADRASLAPRWASALGGGGARPTMRRVARINHTPRQIAFSDTLRHLVITGLLAGLFGAAGRLRGDWLPTTLANYILAFLALAMLYALPRLLLALYLLVRNGTLEASLGQVGQVILDMMAETNLLSVSPSDVRPLTDRGGLGEALIRLEGGSRGDENLFLDAIDEVLGPIENPRYLIERRSRFGWRLRTDFHAVPTIFGRSAERAAFFAKRWNRRVGWGRLVYLRNPEGRRTLLRARARSFAAGFQRAVGRLSQWG